MIRSTAVIAFVVASLSFASLAGAEEIEAPRKIRLEGSAGLAFPGGDIKDDAKAKMSFDVQLEGGYMFMPHLSAHVIFNDTFYGFEDDSAFDGGSAMAFGAGLRYELELATKITAFGEGSLLYGTGSFDIKSGQSIDVSGFGVQLRAGAFYALSPMLWLGGGLSYTILSLEDDNDNSASASNLGIDVTLSIRI